MTTLNSTPLAGNQSINRSTWLLLLLCCVVLLPFLGETLFNTRGEPREAVVALSMLKDGNWVLPINNGVDMAYKPPFFHWLVALCSLPIGHVTEYTSRLPSALALIAMVVAGFRFFAHRRGEMVAWYMALITLTSFEVHRAGVACRVDMVLTCMMVLALYQLYAWVERGMHGLPVWGILCLSGALLSKGPVGAALPCLVVAVFAWVRGRGFWPVLWRMAVVGVLSCVLPAAWYVAAYAQGGQRFLDLVYEENVLRLLGKMTYESHVNPWPYNVLTLITGFVPYTLLLLMSLFVVNWRKVIPANHASVNKWSGACTRLKQGIGSMNDARLFALLSAVVIFVFYCIPKSKRSVYLLPVYPFVAYYIAELLIWLRAHHRKVVSAFGLTMATLSLLLCVSFVAVRVGVVPESLLGQGKHAAQNVAMLTALRTTPLNVLHYVAFFLTLFGALHYVRQRAERAMWVPVFYMIMAIYISLDCIYQPMVLNTKSDKWMADYIAQQQPAGQIYSFRTEVTPGNPLHPFTINYYLGDRVAPFEAIHPQQGLLIVGNDEICDFSKRYPHYQVTLVRDFNHMSCDDHKWLKLYRFDVKN